MLITVWDVFCAPIFQQCNPQIAAGAAGMRNAVRWAYTQERYDVTEFLVGGEILIIEGSALAEHADDEGLIAYVDALHRAKVSALAMELVDFFNEVPRALAQRADELGLPVIGLRRRMPFVALCQEINAAITREQLTAHLQVDNLSTSLASRFSLANTVSDVARALADTLGEHVTIIAADGSLAASEGLDGVTERSKDMAFRVPSADGMPVATVIVTQYMTVMEPQARSCITSLLTQTLPAFVTSDIGEKLQVRLLCGMTSSDMGPSAEEILQTQDMIRALGLLTDMRALPFAVRVEHWDHGAQVLSKCIARVKSMMIPRRMRLILALDGELLVGAILSDDASWFASMSEFGHDVLRTFAETGGDAVQIVEGLTASDAVNLLTALSAVRFAAESLGHTRGHAYARKKSSSHGQGAVVPVSASAYRRLLSVATAQDAVHTFVSQVAGPLIDADDMLIDTLCVLMDCMGSKTMACEWLGIQRQTLYNRLERVERLTGISQHDTVSWSAMLVGVKLIHELRALD